MPREGSVRANFQHETHRCAVKTVVLINASEQRDTRLRNELVMHLAPLRTSGRLDVWHEGLAKPGAPHDTEFDDALARAAVVVVLLTPDLLADSERMARVERAKKLGKRLFPVLVRACGWQESPCANLKILPSNGRPVGQRKDRGDAWTEVAAALSITDADNQIPPSLETEIGRRPPNNLPPERLFVGRQADLSALRRRLTSSRITGITHRTSVYGLGGVGKTSLALAFAHAYAADYPGGIYWVRAEGDPTNALILFFAELRAVAPPPVSDVLARLPANDPQAVAAGVRLALQNNPERSLLVLDNIDVDWRSYVPGNRVHVLVTTRDPDLALGDDELGPVRLDMLSRDDAIALAEAIAGPYASAETAARERVVVTELGGLAVAVEMAARAVKRWTKSWTRYELLLAKQERTLLGDDPKLFSDYGRGAFAAIDLSVGRCREKSARALLESLATLAPGRAPMEWAEAGAGLNTDALEPIRGWEEVTATGLVNVDIAARKATLHRLVHRRLAHTLTSEARDSRALRMADAMIVWLHTMTDMGRAAAFPADERRTWIHSANELATHFWLRGTYARARDLFERALNEAKRLDPPDEQQLSVQLNSLAMVLRDLGDTLVARRLLEEALDIDQKVLGPAHPNVAISLSNLATVLRDLGDTTTARSLIERALEIDMHALGPEHPNVAVRLSNLATVLVDLRNPDGAKALLERALAIDTRALGTEHPTIAVDLSNLAEVLRSVGDTAGARPLLERALQIDQNALGPEHATVSTRLFDLGEVLRDLGQMQDARSLASRALAIAERCFGRSHPRTQSIRDRLALLSHATPPDVGRPLERPHASPNP